jgi:hypothetical protein
MNTGGQAGPIRGSYGCITDRDLIRVNGNPIVNNACNATSSQLLGFGPAGSLHWFAAYGSYCMDVVKAGTTPGTTIQFLACNGSVAQQYTFTADGKLMNPHSKLCVGVKNSITAPNTPLILGSCASTSKGLLWDPTPLASKRGELTSGLGASGQYCVTGPAYGAPLGTPITLRVCNLSIYNGQYPNTAALQVPTQVIAHIGTTLRASGGCVTQSRAVSGAPVWIAPCIGAPTQQWKLGPNNSVVNVYNHLCLDDPKSTKPTGTAALNLQSYTCNGTAAQSFTLPDK